MTWAFQPLLPGAARLQASGGSYTLAADAGAFALSGQSAQTPRSLRLGASQGNIAFSGQAAGLRRALLLQAAPGTIAFIGFPADLNGGELPTGEDAGALDLSISIGL